MAVNKLGHDLNYKVLTTLWKQLTIDERLLGANWYRSVNNACISNALQAKINLTPYVGIVATLSPGLPWHKNLEAANTLIRALQSGERDDNLPMVTTYSREPIKKAQAIFLDPNNTLSYISGPKVTNFYHNLLNPDDENFVTIDRHAVRACYWPDYLSDEESQIKHPRVYARFAEVYKFAAKELGILPNVLQAGLWDFVRKNKPKSLTMEI